MKTIAIFGNHYGVLNKELNYEDNIGLSWVEHLSKKYNVHNFCEPNATFRYCYKLWSNTYHNFDKSIFLIPSPGGITIDIPSLSNLNLRHKHFASFDDTVNLRSYIDNLLKIKYDNNIRFDSYKLQAVENYFMYIMNKEFDYNTQYLCVDNMKQSHYNTVVIPCFIDSEREPKTAPLYDINYKELKTFFNEPFIHRYEDNLKELNASDYRKCFMTKENNYLFYLEIEKWLAGKPVEIDVNIFLAPAKNTFDCYWKSND